MTRRRPADVRRSRARLRRLAGIARPALLVVVLPVAALGALGLTPPQVLALVPLGAAVAATVAGIGHEGSPQGPGSRRVVALAAAWGALAVPFLAGVPPAGSAGAVAVGLVVVLGGVVAVDALGRALERAPVEAVRAAAGELSLAELCVQWRLTEEALGPGARPGARADALAVRGVLLDEFASRDPAGLAQWLHQGSADPPEHWSGQDAPR
ncbi:hypothetical protein SAMN05660464_2867 [Geodermatophilus dictyosporus]|uniref:Uncharacterized protein n=1 Tax=Geodermatophilus dictyosporus TaxID=1523247 RepID=A0A1I5PKA8_9ACTN|nr:hypothetical protein [Geodermatophilus dictyosporus]SFP34449.1 hypothetical protein SAMN05660464_2867 [Geodermatophilus dictyosporus]